MPKLFVQTTWFMLRTCLFAYGRLEFWHMLYRGGAGGYMWVPPVRQHLTLVVTSQPVWLHRDRTLGTGDCFPQTSLAPMCLRSLAGSALNSCAAIPKTMRRTLLSPVSLPAESPNGGLF